MKKKEKKEKKWKKKNERKNLSMTPDPTLIPHTANKHKIFWNVW